MVPSDPTHPVGTFVVEVGRRQAWPFLTFCNNDLTPPVETRLYIDTDWTVSGGGLDDLMMLSVSGVARGDGAELSVTFTDGQVLTISGQPNAETTHDVWWLGSA